MRDPYTVLGVSRSVSEKDLKSAYRRLAKANHPDQNQKDPKAQQKFAEISAAYDFLTDKDKKAAFDRGEIDADGSPKFSNFGGAGMGGGRSAGRRQERAPGSASAEDIPQGVHERLRRRADAHDPRRRRRLRPVRRSGHGWRLCTAAASQGRGRQRDAGGEPRGRPQRAARCRCGCPTTRSSTSSCRTRSRTASKSG